MINNATRRVNGRGAAVAALIIAAALLAVSGPAEAMYRHHHYYRSLRTHSYIAYGYYPRPAYAPYARPSGPWWDYAY